MKLLEWWLVVFGVLCAVALVATVAARTAGTQRVGTRPLPDRTATDQILAGDGLTFPSQKPMVCYNGAGDVVMILDWQTGQFRFDFSAGLTQSGKCRN